jgi:hypothetical protein
MADQRDHDAFMYGWRLWERGKPRPAGLMNRKGWDAAKKAAGKLKDTPLSEYADAIEANNRIIYEEDGDVLSARPGRQPCKTN